MDPLIEGKLWCLYCSAKEGAVDRGSAGAERREDVLNDGNTPQMGCLSGSIA